MRDLLHQGTDCFRINCAHDTRDEWSGMVANIRRAARELDRRARIAMDLAGQKPRTEEVLAPDAPRRLRAGDSILLTAGMPAARSDHSFQARCSLPQVLPALRIGATVTFDDGRMTSGWRRCKRRSSGYARRPISRSYGRPRCWTAWPGRARFELL